MQAQIKIPIPTQRRVLKDGKGMLNCSSSTGKLWATEHQGYAGNPEIPKGSDDSKPQSQIWPHHFQKSPDCVLHLEKVFSIV